MNILQRRVRPFACLEPDDATIIPVALEKFVTETGDYIVDENGNFLCFRL